jgi:hypothetical protein
MVETRAEAYRADTAFRIRRARLVRSAGSACLATWTANLSLRESWTSVFLIELPKCIEKMIESSPSRRASKSSPGKLFEGTKRARSARANDKGNAADPEVEYQNRVYNTPSRPCSVLVAQSRNWSFFSDRAIELSLECLSLHSWIGV